MLVISIVCSISSMNNLTCKPRIKKKKKAKIVRNFLGFPIKCHVMG